MKHPLKWILLAVLFVLLADAQKVFAVVRNTSVSKDPDINIRERGWVENESFSKAIQPHPNAADPKAPQLSTLIGDAENHNPLFTYLGQVYAVNGKAQGILDSSNIQSPGIGKIQANGGATIYSPRQGYDIGGGFSYVVLYATNTDIVIHNTAEDSVASGYTLHILDINVDKKLLDLYNQNEANGRPQLVAIGCHIPLGTVAGSDVLFDIRDTGSHMPPTFEDWWKLPVLKDCKETPPGLLSAAKKPPKGELLDKSGGKTPLTSVDTKDVGLGGDYVSAAQPVILNADEFSKSITYPNWTHENEILNGAFHDSNGGGKLTPAYFTQGEKEFIYPEEQADYTQKTALKEIYAAGCGKAALRVKSETDQSKQEQYSKAAAQSAPLPTPYVRMLAHSQIAASILTPGESTTGQIRAYQPSIVTKNSDGTFTLTPEYQNQLFHCGDDTPQKQVEAVVVPAEGPIQQILASVGSVISNVINFLIGRDCTKTSDGKETCYDKNAAKVDVTNTKTVFTPYSEKLDKNIKNFTSTFIPNTLLAYFPKDDGFTNRSKVLGTGTNNVLGTSTADDISHFRASDDKDSFNKVSSCMLLPASIQQQRGTADKDCKLEGRAAPTSSTIPTPSSACNPKNASNINSGPKNTYMSDGLIALAIKVSRYTCTPAEFLVGVMSGETRGLNYDGTTNSFIKGDPNESICRTISCVTNQTGDLGPFSWSKFLYQDQFKTWGPLATDCFNAIGTSVTPDSRLLGQDMCVTSSKFWGSMHDNGNPVGSCSGANQKSYNLDDIPVDKRRLAYMHFCGSSSKCEQFWQKDVELIDAYKAAVARVKGEMASCLH